jgi:heterodisulfide reductase subunit C
MVSKVPFSQEIGHLMFAVGGNPIDQCIQCGTCAGVCPSAPFMQHSPRQIIDLIRAGLRKEVLSSNTFWYCASCYQCTVRCPQGIQITDMMYALKRYTMWRSQHAEDLIGPDFCRSFVTQILKTGRSFEPAMAPVYMFKLGLGGFVREGLMGTSLFFKGRMPLFPKKIKRIDNFRRMIAKIVPMEGIV